MTIKQIASREIYKNKWLSLREDTVLFPNGKQGIYSVVERPPVNFIIASNENKKITFIYEYRYPINKTILQLPAGTVEPTESTLESAKRELLQETNTKADNWLNLGHFFIGPGHETVRANIWLATSLTKQINSTPNNLGESNEAILQTKDLSLNTIKEKINSNKIECGITLAALNLYLSQEQ